MLFRGQRGDGTFVCIERRNKLLDGLNICRHLNEYLLTVKYDILIFVAVGSDRLMFLECWRKKNYNKNYEKHKHIPFRNDIYFYTTHFSFITSLIGFYWHLLKNTKIKKGLFEKAGE